jgi:hypothetical protein
VVLREGEEREGDQRISVLRLSERVLYRHPFRIPRRKILLTLRPRWLVYEAKEIAEVAVPGRNPAILSFEHYRAGYHCVDGILKLGLREFVLPIMLDGIIGIIPEKTLPRPLIIPRGKRSKRAKLRIQRKGHLIVTQL